MASNGKNAVLPKLPGYDLTKYNRGEQAQLIMSSLMSGGKEDDQTCTELDFLTRLFNEDIHAAQAGYKDHQPVHPIIDIDCVDTILSYLDMRQEQSVRGHATITISAYLKAAGDQGNTQLSAYFYDKVKKARYDDFIAAFCVASALFPIAPDIITELFLSEGFLPSLGPLMRRTWKSRKVETACLEMLNAACMHATCRDAVQKYCTEWLEEVVDMDPNEAVKDLSAQDPGVHADGGSISMRRHCEQVKQLAAVILTKLRAVPSTQPPELSGSRIKPATTSVEDLTNMISSMLLKGDEDGNEPSVEGLAYGSIQPQVRENIAKNPELLKKVVQCLSAAPPKSSMTYAALSILNNLTCYPPSESEEQKKMNQLKAYANAAGKLLDKDPLLDDVHIAARCKAVFEAGAIPVLVSHVKNTSAASLTLVVSILHSLSVTQSLRGSLAQQGAVNLLITAWAALPEKATSNPPPRAVTAQALARILISINPVLIFGGNRPTPMESAIRPLSSILTSDHNTDGPRDLLPTFEALMALTNLASVNDQSRRAIARVAWPALDDLLLSSVSLVSRASVELLCNLAQDPVLVESYFIPTGDIAIASAARNRLNILLALADATDTATRSAAGGALASLTADSRVVEGILNRPKGVNNILGLCKDDKEDLKHRGVFVVYNMIAADGNTGKKAQEQFLAANALEVLKETAKASRSEQVIEVTAVSLKILLGEE